MCVFLLKRVSLTYGAEKRGTEFGISGIVFLSSYVNMCVCDSVGVCVVESVGVFLDVEGCT